MRNRMQRALRKRFSGAVVMLALGVVTSAFVVLALGGSQAAQAGSGPDTDGDGCSDERELGPVPAYGGQRDPNDFWDFFDVPTGAYPNLNRDQSISGLDFFAVLGRFNRSGNPAIDPLSLPPPGLSYHTGYDRTSVQGASGPPDGMISGIDFFLVLGQFNDSCTGATAPSVWHPTPGTTWQWQLTGSIDTSVAAQAFDIDLFDVGASVVNTLHGQGKKVICYMSAGSWEDWRPDADDFPSSVKGNSNGWPGEQWLDVRQLSILGPIMEARLDTCAAKGFDAVEFDNVDGYTNSTGFPLTAQHQRTYNTFLANEAHERGLAAALKNDLDQVGDLVGVFDFAINEQCFEYDECDMLEPFINANKAVLITEYDLNVSQFCPEANAAGFSAMKKNLNLDAWRQVCW